MQSKTSPVRQQIKKVPDQTAPIGYADIQNHHLDMTLASSNILKLKTFKSLQMIKGYTGCFRNKLELVKSELDKTV